MVESGNPQVTCCELAWAACLVDGEGSVTIYKAAKNAYWGCVTVINTDAGLLGKYTGILTRLGVPFYLCTRGPRNGGNLSCTDVRVSRANALLTFIDLLLPHLVAKRDRAQLLREWVNEKLQEALARPGYDSRGRPRHTRRLNRRATAYDTDVYAVMKALQRPGHPNEHTWASNQFEKMCSDLRRKAESWQKCPAAACDAV